MAGDIFPGCSNGFLISNLSPMHLEEEGCDISLAPTEALYVAICYNRSAAGSVATTFFTMTIRMCVLCIIGSWQGAFMGVMN